MSCAPKTPNKDEIPVIEVPDVATQPHPTGPLLLPAAPEAPAADGPQPGKGTGRGSEQPEGQKAAQTKPPD
jgi:hypothetical protein